MIDEFAGAYAHFCGQTLCVSHNVPVGDPAQQEQLPPEIVVMEMRNDEEQWQGWSRLSSSIHETRHFYDWIGTPLGVVLFDHLQRVVNEYFVRIGASLPTRDDIQIPLVEHIKDNQKDGAVQQFLDVYRWNMDRYAWLMGHTAVPEGVRHEGLISALAPAEGSRPQPIVRMEQFACGGQKFRWERRLFPLGGRQIVEGLAFAVEREYLRRLAPAQVARFERTVFSAASGWHYALPFFVMERIVGEAPADLLAQACEFALCLPGQPSGPKEIHPGWRYIALLEALRETGDLSASGFAQAVARLGKKEKWSSPEASLRAACQYADAQVTHNANNPERSIVKSYNLIYYSLAATMFRVRMRAGFPHASIEGYLNAIDSDSVPKPPLKRLQQAKRSRLLLQNGYPQAMQGILLTWFVLEDMVHRVTQLGNLGCALKHGSLPGVCPLETAQCGSANQFVEQADGDKCVYGSVLETFGFL
jgi:hypothetical protein